MNIDRVLLKHHIQRLPIRFILFMALIAGALFVFAVVVNEVLWEKEEEIDQAIFNFLSQHVVSHQWTGFMETITHFASSLFLQIAYGALFLIYLIVYHFKKALQIAVVGLGGYLVVYLMKMSFRRSRPPDPLIEPLQNFSFPSGHATSGFIFYGLLAYLVWKMPIAPVLKYIACILLFIFLLLVGFSRIYLRVHYPSDVLAGFCIGFAWLLLNVYWFEKMERKSASLAGKKN